MCGNPISTSEPINMLFVAQPGLIIPCSLTTLSEDFHLKKLFGSNYELFVDIKRKLPRYHRMKQMTLLLLNGDMLSSLQRGTCALLQLKVLKVCTPLEALASVHPLKRINSVCSKKNDTLFFSLQTD